MFPLIGQREHFLSGRFARAENNFAYRSLSGRSFYVRILWSQWRRGDAVLHCSMLLSEPKNWEENFLDIRCLLVTNRTTSFILRAARPPGSRFNPIYGNGWQLPIHWATFAAARPEFQVWLCQQFSGHFLNRKHFYCYIDRNVSRVQLQSLIRAPAPASIIQILHLPPW